MKKSELQSIFKDVAASAGILALVLETGRTDREQMEAVAESLTRASTAMNNAIATDREGSYG